MSVVSAHEAYPIGTPGQPWGEDEKARWLAQQEKKRSHADDVLSRVHGLEDRFEIVQYGKLPYEGARHPLIALESRGWRVGRPKLLVTGGVHGYETSGVHGALRFAETAAADYLEHFDIAVVPCVSPWGYETINRWNPRAIDPNRSFYPGSGSPEATLLMIYAETRNLAPRLHFDLHETTDSDNQEFRPALAARDGRLPEALGPIPDGFYTVAPSQHPEPEFQAAVIQSVQKVTPIAPPDDNGEIIECPVQQPGVIHYDKRALHLCGGFTRARFVTTTEVYPDSPKTDPESCILAQVAAIRGGLDYVIEHKLTI